MIIQGFVDATGKVIQGSGFSVKKGATGGYFLNFGSDLTVGSSALPVVIPTVNAANGGQAAAYSISETGCTITTRTASGIVANLPWSFIAVIPGE